MRSPNDVLGKNVELFPSYPSWFPAAKVQSSFATAQFHFTTWGSAVYSRFKYRPVTGTRKFMAKTARLFPCRIKGKVGHTCIILYDVTEIATNRLQLQRANHQLHIISRTDGLTGLLNRKTWEELLQHEFKRFSRYGHTCSLLMFDIDHFKRVNDTYGHPAGDEVIRQTAAVVRKCA